MNAKKVARDVELLAAAEREFREKWMPRLGEMQEAAERLKAAGWAGASDVAGRICETRGEGMGKMEGDLAALLEDLKRMCEGEGDELWYKALCHAADMDQVPTLHDRLLKVGREHFHAALRAMPLDDQARALTWLGDEEYDYMWDQPCPEVAQLYSAASGLTVEPGEPRRRPTPEQSAQFRRAAAALLASVEG